MTKILQKLPFVLTRIGRRRLVEGFQINESECECWQSGLLPDQRGGGVTEPYGDEAQKYMADDISTGEP